MSFLGGLGMGLSQFAMQEHQQKQEEIARKEREKNLQLQGLHVLLGQNDLPMDQYVDTISAIGQLTGHKPTQQAADMIRSHLGQQSNISQPVQQVTPQPAAAGTQAAGIESQIGPPPPMTQVTHPTLGQLPRDVYNEQQMMPLKIAERRAAMKLSQQVDPSDPEYTLWFDQQGNLVNRTHSQVASVANKQAGIDAAKANISTRMENQLKLVDERGKVKAHADVDRLVASGMSPEDASAYVLNKAQQENNVRDARIGLMQVQKQAIPERVAQGWANVESNQLRTQIQGDLAKKNIDTAAFDRQTKFAFDDLNHVNSEIDALQKRPDLLNGNDRSWNEQLLNLTNQRNTLLNYIYTQKGQFVPAEQAQPRSGGGVRSSPKYVPPKVSRDKLQSLMQP